MEPEQTPFTKEQIELLETPLTMDEIETKQGNRYLAGHLARKKANRIFGHGKWGYRKASDFDMHDTGRTTSNGQPIFLVSVQITLKIRGCVPITEWGDCECNGMNASSVSMAKKGAITDGLKRCLMNYGPAFGADLYDPDWKPAPAKPKVPAKVQTPLQQTQPAAPRPVAPPPTPQPQAPVAVALNNAEELVAKFTNAINGTRSIPELLAVRTQMANEIPSTSEARAQLRPLLASKESELKKVLVGAN